MPRSSSSSSYPPPKSGTHFHLRRSSRLPSPSSLSLPLPPPSPPPTAPSLPPLVLSIGSAVDRLLRPLSKPPRKPHPRRYRPYPIFRLLLLLFLAFFISLFLLLRFLFPPPVSRTPPSPQIAHNANLARIARHQPPTFSYPPSALSHSLASSPSIIHSNIPLSLLLANRFPVSWHHRSSSPIRLSLISASMARGAYLAAALPGWCNALGPDDEIVLVDWGTVPPDDVPVDVVVNQLAPLLSACRIVIVRVNAVSSWILGRAVNLGVRMARGQWILKVDADTLIAEGGLDGIALPRGVGGGEGRRSEEDFFYYRGFWDRAVGENDQHLNGVFLARKEDFDRVGGYDERIVTYGWDDSDLYRRLEKDGVAEHQGLRPVDFKPGALSHIAHGDGLRGANQRLVMGPVLETQINEQATEALPPWTKVAAMQESEYEFDLVARDGSRVLARIVHSPQSLLDHLSKPEQTKIVDEATNRVLHDSYGFPWSVLGEINRSRAELVRSLALLGTSTHWESGNGVIFAEVGGTTPERVLGVASAIGLALEFERPLFLAWSSGTREEPTPRVTDFFDVDNSGVVDEEFGEAGKGARVYQIGRWKCRGTVETCSKTDTAFGMMVEYRSGRHGAEEEDAAQRVLDVLHGKVKNKRNVLLRLEGKFPLQRVEQRVRAMGSLTPSHGLAEELGRMGEVDANCRGLYVGHGVRQRGVEAMLKRVSAHYGPGGKYLVSGLQREMVDVTKKLLGDDLVVQGGSGDVGVTNEIRGITRDIAELFGLAHCGKGLVNDGRPPQSVIEIVSLVKRKEAEGG